MPPRGRFAGRRGSTRGGGIRGRGRGRGRGTRSYGRASKYNNSRLAEIERSGDEDCDRSSQQSDIESEAEEVVSDDEETKPTVRPYLALMQSFADQAEASAPRVKRRKLNNGEKKGHEVAIPEHEHPLEPDDRDLDFVEDQKDPADDDLNADREDEEDAEGDEDNPDSSDTFETHFVNPDQGLLRERIRNVQDNKYQLAHASYAGWTIVTSTPGEATGNPSQPAVTFTSPTSLKLKHRLIETIFKKRPNFDSLEQILYPTNFNYQDLLFCGRASKNAESLRRMACLHAVNHVFKTRDRVIKNNARLAKEGETTTFEPRDQGFTRPKVLMLLPTRHSAVRVVNEICSLCDPEQQENRKRFDESYLDKEAKFAEDRPEDFRELFEGNDDDMFRLGVKFTRRTIKYFSQFYNSDILLASPLGLRMAIGSEEDRKSKKQVDYDFLSSIEIVILDQADALLMQNWEHVEYIVEHLNLQPRDAHDCDFSRVREWYLEKQAPNFRQTIIFSAFNTPELTELHRQGKNWAGRIHVQPGYSGAIQELGIQIRQTFSRFEASSLAAEPDSRFEYFTSAAVPSLAKRSKDLAGTLVFVPSYLDFVRVRNYFATSSAVENLTFGAISEYADVPEASRARSHFLSGRHQILLYTERAHHFRRYTLRGVKRVVMYGLPDNPLFYREIAGGFLGRSWQDHGLEPGQGTVRVVFSKYDALKLARIVGSQRVGKMVREKGDTFHFT